MPAKLVHPLHTTPAGESAMLMPYIRILLVIALSSTTLWGADPTPVPTPKVSKTAQELAEGKGKQPQDRQQPLQPLVVVKKPKASLDGAFGTQYISNPVETSFGDRIISGEDITQYEMRVMHAIIDGDKDAPFQWDPKVPATRRFLINKRYHPGDPRLPELLKKVVDQKYGMVGQISHLDDALEVLDWGGQDILTKLNDKTVRPQDDEDGKVIKELREMGFGYATGGKLPNYFIAGPPLTRKKDPNQRVDLMHEKAWLIGELDAKGNVVRAFAFPGTSNQVPHSPADGGSKFESTRFNRAFTIVDPDMAKFNAQVALDNARQYSQGTRIRDLDEGVRQRVVFKDGWVEQGFTHGSNNLNARIVAIKLHAVQVQGQDGKMRPLTQEEVERGFDRDISEAFKEMKELSGWVPTEMWESDFVETYSPAMLKADKMLYEQYPHLRGDSGGDKRKISNSFKLVDAKFAIDVTGFGLVTPQNGIDLLRPMGGVVFGWGQYLTPDTYVYLRGTGKPEQVEDGPPVARYLQHDKTGGMAGSLNGKPIAFLRTGSFNYSNADGNAEDQRLFRFDNPDSWIYKGTRESVQYLIQNDPKALRFTTAIHIANVARMTGRGQLEVTPEQGDDIWEHIIFGEFDQAKAKLLALAKKDSNLQKRPSFEEMKRRIENLIAYLEKDKELRPEGYGIRKGGRVQRGPQHRLMKLADIATILTADLPKARVAFELRGLAWFPQGDDAEIERRAQESWKLLGLDGEMPAKGTWEPPPKTPIAGGVDSPVEFEDETPPAKRKPAGKAAAGAAKKKCDPAKMAPAKRAPTRRSTSPDGPDAP